MRRRSLFTFRINNYERTMIKALAEQLQRSQSDAVRFIVINAARELRAQQRKSENGNTALENCLAREGLSDAI